MSKVKSKILIFAESRYKINRKKIRKTIDDFLKVVKIKSQCEISLAFVGDRKMKALNLG